MPDIQRFSFATIEPFQECPPNVASRQVLQPDPEGDLVRYEDHVRTVEALEQVDG